MGFSGQGLQEPAGSEAGGRPQASQLSLHKAEGGVTRKWVAHTKTTCSWHSPHPTDCSHRNTRGAPADCPLLLETTPNS